MTGLPAIDFRTVGVSYPGQRIVSVKEFAVRALKGRREEAFWALRDVSFSLAAGESLGIVGGNGAGKSTLLRVAAGIIGPSSGEVVVRGSVAPLIELGTGFDTELTGRENILFNGSLLGRSRTQMLARLDEIAGFADLGEFLDAPLRTYSTGMVARLAFSIATSVDADIVLLDEILSVGDAAFQEKCEQRIQRFYQSGATVVLVSHDLASVARLCKVGMWLHDGTIRAFGPAGEVIERYLDFLHGAPQVDESLARPELTSIEPTSGPASGGHVITVWGKNLVPPTSITVGTVPSVSFGLVHSEAIRVAVPALRPGSVNDVVVRSPAGRAALRRAYLADFLDVPESSLWHRSVEALVRRNFAPSIRGGFFRPDAPVTRREFVSVLFRLTQPGAASEARGLLNDESYGTWVAELCGEELINRWQLQAVIAEADELLSRAEMSLLLLRARFGASMEVPLVEGLFDDVPVDARFAGFIEELYRRKLVAGCSVQPLQFCPEDPLTRGQMAALLVGAFDAG